MNKCYYAFIMSMSLLAIFACNQQDRNRYKGQPLSEVDSLQNKMAADSGRIANIDKNFVKTVQYDALFEIEAGKLAAKQAKDVMVQNYGTAMVGEHTQFSKDLADIVVHRDVEMPTTMDSSRMKQLDYLRTKQGNAFDKAYMKTMVENHRVTLSAFIEAGDQAKDVHIQAFANKNVGNVKKHLTDAQELYDSISK